MDPTFVVTADATPAALADRAMPLLAADPVVNGIVANVVETRAAGEVPTEPGCSWLSVADGTGRPVGVAVRTPPRGLALTTMPVGAAAAIADHCAATGLVVPETSGPAEVGTEFAERYAGLTGTRAERWAAQRVHRLGDLVPPTAVPGAFRAATAADTETVLDWVRAFMAETHASAADMAEPTLRRLRAGDLLWLWTRDDAPVAMNWVSRPTLGVVRLSGVYTPPERRGTGYASALVAATSRLVLERDAAVCMLYTDLANPVSNRIYRRLGYRPVAEVTVWRFH